MSITDRNGQTVDVIELPGVCCGMEWSRDGALLAIIQDKTPDVLLWDASSKKTMALDTTLKSNPTFLAWAQQGTVLAVGTAKGGLLIYNHHTSRKTTFLGKHTKKITCGTWSDENMLVLGSEDHSVTINNSEGDLLQQPLLHGDPSDIQIHNTPSGAKISIVVNKQTLYLINVNDPDNPLELAFQAKYGNIVSYRWFGEGRLLMGFASGFFVVVSTDLKQIGQELFQARNHKVRLNDIICSTTLNKAATCGDNCIKIHDLADLTDVFAIITLDEDRGMLDQLQWSDDGQLLSISTQSGTVHSYLTRLPMLGAANGQRLVYLSSLQELSFSNLALARGGTAGNPARGKVRLTVEPAFVAVGPYYAASGLNNSVWFYNVADDGSLEPAFREPRTFVSSVKSLFLNADYAAGLGDGRLQLLKINNEQSDGQHDSRLFPDKPKEEKITCAALTNALLIYGTETGGLHYFFIDDWAFVNEFRHVVGIKMLAPDTNGTRLLFLDDKGDAYIYNPVNDALLEIPFVPVAVKGFVWDHTPSDQPLFAVYDEENIHVYLYSPNHIRGPQCDKVNTTRLPPGHMPLVLTSTSVTCLSPSGKTTEVVLETHDAKNPDSMEWARETVAQHVGMGRYQDALVVAHKFANDAKSLLEPYVKTVLEALDVSNAIHFYRLMGQPSQVNALRKIEGVEDRFLLGGHVAILLHEYGLAQDLFLKSSNPVEALNMHRDLLQWDQALKLAQKLAPAELPAISKEYGQQLELTGNYQQALEMFEAGLQGGKQDRAHLDACRAGLARMLARLGDLRRAVKYTEEVNSRQLFREVGGILESQGHGHEAAAMFERADLPERAAAVYIKSKNWTKAGEALKSVANPKLHLQYAKAREADGSYREAAAAYEAAKDWLAVVRINLDHLRNPEAAVAIVKSKGSVEGAKMVARFFMNLGDFASAIQFLVLSKCSREAFQMAQTHNQMDIYAQVIGDDATPEDLKAIAAHFEKQNDLLQAGRAYLRAGDHATALKHFLRCHTEDGSHIEAAIEAVSTSPADTRPRLSQQLFQFLMGETDGRPKDFSYVFKLHMGLKEFAEAARTAVILAREEQNAGNYRNARDMLLNMYRQLQTEGIRISADMSQSLMLLHSYLIVKIHIKRNDHTKGARMLVRVANSISRFPTHVVNILTSAVIECYRSGLKNSAFTFAAMLMRPEYRQKLDPKYKKKIEQIVRKPERTEAPEEDSPCPYCKSPVKVTSLHCKACENLLPYCIATGQHMVADDWAECPHCHFPAIYKELAALLDTEEACPMCSHALGVAQIVRIQDCSFRLRESKDMVEKGAPPSAATPDVPSVDVDSLAQSLEDDENV